jgi:hypothetical protein
MALLCRLQQIWSQIYQQTLTSLVKLSILKAQMLKYCKCCNQHSTRTRDLNWTQDKSSSNGAFQLDDNCCCIHGDASFHRIKWVGADGTVLTLRAVRQQDYSGLLPAGEFLVTSCNRGLSVVQALAITGLTGQKYYVALIGWSGTFRICPS